MTDKESIVGQQSFAGTWEVSGIEQVPKFGQLLPCDPKFLSLQLTGL